MIIIKRYITAIIGIAILVPLCIFSNTCAWPIGVTVFSVIAAIELTGAMGYGKKAKLLVPNILLALMPSIVWFFKFKMDVMLPTGLFFSGLSYLLYMLILSVFADDIDMNDIAALSFYSLYVAYGFTAFALIRFFSHGVYLMIISFLAPWSTDTFAYFGGKLFGKHKLCPSISPNKTVEGSVTGSVSQMLIMALFAFIINKFYDAGASVVNFAFFGAILSVISQFGDLFMSRIKRKCNIKDFGNIFPGHGGSLDRFDSVIAVSLAIIFVYFAVGLKFLFI